MEHDHIGRMQAHNEADGDDHFQMGRLILFAAAADLGKQIGAAPADERDERKPEPVQGMIPQIIYCTSGSVARPASAMFCRDSRMPSLA